MRATGKASHLVVYAGDSISRFICQPVSVPLPANQIFGANTGLNWDSLQSAIDEVKRV